MSNDFDYKLKEYRIGYSHFVSLEMIEFQYHYEIKFLTLPNILIHQTGIIIQ